MNKTLEKLQEIYEFIFDSPLIAVAEFLCFLFTLVASLYFFATGIADILLPRFGWLAITCFMLVGGTQKLTELMSTDEFPEEEEEEQEDEDEEGEDD